VDTHAKAAKVAKLEAESYRLAWREELTRCIELNKMLTAIQTHHVADGNGICRCGAYSCRIASQLFFDFPLSNSAEHVQAAADAKSEEHTRQLYSAIAALRERLRGVNEVHDDWLRRSRPDQSAVLFRALHRALGYES
jgi:hypothetical protein